MTINQANVSALELAKKAIDLGAPTKEDLLVRLGAYYNTKCVVPIRAGQQSSLPPFTPSNKSTSPLISTATNSTTSNASSATPLTQNPLRSYSSHKSNYDRLKSEPTSRFSESERLLIEYFKSRDILEAISVNETASAKPPGPGYDQEEYDEAKTVSNVQYEKFEAEFLRVSKGEEV